MAKKITQTIEELIRAKILNDVKEMEKKLLYGIVPQKPTRFFKLDERVYFGAHKEVYIRGIYRDGLYYTIECLNVSRGRDSVPANEVYVTEWHELLPYKETIPTTFKKKDISRLSFFQSSISSLLTMVYFAGVDFDVDYQRDHVWTYADKVALIDSIFNNVDIGKFVFVQRDFGHNGKLYEIIDGKQRLTTLCEFYEDRFSYNGYFYSEISPDDKNKFEGHGIAYGYLEQPTREAILETFIKLNTCGKPMASKDIDKVKELLNEHRKQNIPLS